MTRIAILGNMNNNHFSLMRYLRDLGLDAYLLLYKDEAVHFLPECDTWEIEKWKAYIVQTDLTNGVDWKGTLMLPFQKNRLKRIFENYAVIIANGFGPAYTFFAGRTLDLWVPYGLGGEFLIQESTLGIFQKVFFNIRRMYQVKGLTQTKQIVSIDNSVQNLVNYKRYNLEHKIVDLLIPMVYVEEKRNPVLRPEVQLVAELIQKSKLSVFSHVSHFWKSIRPFEKNVGIKKNDVLIEAFSHYYEKSKKRDFKLFLFDYGPDTHASKELIKELGINDAVHWCPLMDRKEIMYLLSLIDIGCGELGGYLWGGTGYEFLSNGVPFFQYVKKEQIDSFENSGIPFPFILNFDKSSEIGECILAIESNPSKITNYKRELKDWFQEQAGLELAKKYADLLSIEH